MSDYVASGPPAGPLRRSSPSVPSDNRRLALHLIGIVALAFVLVTSGAFGSDDLALERRILMFGVVSTLLVLQASVLADVARRVLRPSLIGTAGAGAAVLAATLALMTLEIHVLKATPIIPYAPDPLPGFALFLMPFVVPVSALVLGLKWSARGGREASSVVPEARMASTKPASAAPVRQPGDPIHGWPREAVRRIQAVDHYLQLWTAGGTRLVRGRMRDALRRLPDAAGIQPHRSWWIALSEIERIEQRGRDHVLRLRDGDRVPVARSRAADVKRRLGGMGDV